MNSECIVCDDLTRELEETKARLAEVEADTVSFLREHAELTLVGRASDPFLDGYSEALNWAADSIAYRAVHHPLREGDR